MNHSPGHPRIPWSAALLAALITLVMLSSISGCRGRQSENIDGGSLTETDIPVRNFLDPHNARAERLKQTVSWGTVELRWEDESGSHFQNADIECVIRQPSESAFRIDKAGTIIFWFGSDDDRYWLFDDSGDDTVLWTRPHPEPGVVDPEAFLILPAAPLALLDLLGLTQLEAESPEGMLAREESGGLVCFCQGRAGRLRLTLDPKTLEAIQIELLDEADEPRIRSRLDRFIRAEVPGELEIAWPRFPTLINVEDLKGTTSIRLGLEDPTTDLSDQPLDVLFDLDSMKQVLPPDIIDAETGVRRTDG